MTTTPPSASAPSVTGYVSGVGRRPKVVLFGAGSTVFAKNLLGDILGYPELASAEIALFDIDAERLRTSEVVAHRVARVLGAMPTIVATTDRDRALDGADYVITMIQVAGYKPGTVIDFEIPAKYGLRQTIADTLGIGGIMRAIRTVPVLLDLAADMERLCPNAMHINYANPMAMNCWGLNRGSKIKTVGLCHSVPLTARDLCDDIGVPFDEINYQVAGINHMAFFLKLEHHGEDLYPKVREFLASGVRPARRHDDGAVLADRVRYEVFNRLGYFVTESSEHFSEYVPWFIKGDRPDLIERFEVPLDEYIRRCENQIAGWENLRTSLEDDSHELTVKRSVEFGSSIIHSMETGEPSVIYGNVSNDGIIDNLPAGCTVEVPCLVDRNGVSPTRIGSLPPHLAALMQTNVNVQSLTVEAILAGKREHVYHAAMLDPHTAAELDLDQIWSMVDELLAAHGEWIPAGLR
jgi:alpha-galactosidase